MILFVYMWFGNCLYWGFTEEASALDQFLLIQYQDWSSYPLSAFSQTHATETNQPYVEIC